MSAQMEDYLARLKDARIAVHEMEIRAHEGHIAELRLDEPGASVPALSKAEQALCLAARDLYRAVELLPAARRPKGWYA